MKSIFKDLFIQPWSLYSSLFRSKNDATSHLVKQPNCLESNGLNLFFGGEQALELFFITSSSSRFFNETEPT